MDNLKKNPSQENDLVGKRSSYLSDLFFNNTSRLKRIIAGLGLRAPDAEDILQDLYIQVVKKPFQYEDTNKAVQWLIKVTVNLCLAEHRRKKRFEKKASEILDGQKEYSSNSADAIVIKSEELDIVRYALQQMDDTLLTVLVMRYFCDLDSQQISNILSLNPSTIRSRLRIARIALAKALIEKGIEQ